MAQFWYIIASKCSRIPMGRGSQARRLQAGAFVWRQCRRGDIRCTSALVVSSRYGEWGMNNQRIYSSSRGAKWLSRRRRAQIGAVMTRLFMAGRLFSMSRNARRREAVFASRQSTGTYGRSRGDSDAALRRGAYRRAASSSTSLTLLRRARRAAADVTRKIASAPLQS